jgi:hypothetical protein
MAKNKLHTPSYFIKRLRESGYVVEKVFAGYGYHDPRRWTLVINPKHESILITCYTNKEWFNDAVFEFNDGGQQIPKNFNLHTKSIEVIINYLRTYNIDSQNESRPKKEYTEKKTEQAEE